MSDDVKNIVIPILRELQKDVSALKMDMSTMKEYMGSMNMRLMAVESHMSGFMSTSKYLEIEIDSLRGRVEHIEDQNKHD